MPGFKREVIQSSGTHARSVRPAGHQGRYGCRIPGGEPDADWC